MNSGTPTTDHKHTLCPERHRELGQWRRPHCEECGEPIEEMTLVWCDECDQPSTYSYQTDGGERRALCLKHTAEYFGYQPLKGQSPS